ncbi:MAG TPA: hypothetical protein VLC71_02460 [Thermomonas sp.]|nr:hypothetical protein [Thermomonas sp.]
MQNKTHRTFNVLLLALALALPAHAGKVDRKAAETEARTFIEASHLIAPERVGDFVLEGSSYDEQNKFAGAGFRYALKDHQESRFDVFVYPAGRAPQADAIASGMVPFKAGIEQAQAAGSIRDLRFLSEDEFPLDVPEPARPAAADTELDAALLEAIASTRTIGKRLRMHNTMANGGFPMASNGYLFHRQLYFFKVRASAARDRIDQDAFDALTDRAARELVKAIEVANVGACANAEIAIDPKASADAMALVLVRRSAEIQGENCFGDAGKAKLDEKSKGASVVRIDFTASDWKPR